MSRLDHKAVLPPAQGFPVRCCFVPLSCRNIGKTCQQGFELACFASVGHTSTSYSWSTAQSCAKLQMSLWQTALCSRASETHLALGFPVRFSAETAGHFFHVPWGASGPVSTQSAAFSGSSAFPKEGEEGHWLLSLAGKRKRGAGSEMAFLGWCAQEGLPVAACMENLSCTSAGMKNLLYPHFSLNDHVNGDFRLLLNSGSAWGNPEQICVSLGFG